MDLKYNIVGNCIFFSGTLTEYTNSDEIIDALKKVIEATQNKIEMDFSKVKHANSCGIKIWITCLRNTKPRGYYVAIPEWLVEQINMIDELSDGNLFVKSLEAHFYCPGKNAHETLMLEIGKDIPIAEKLDNWEFEFKNAEGLALDSDFEPKVYFYFLTKRYAKYRDRFVSLFVNED